MPSTTSQLKKLSYEGLVHKQQHCHPRAYCLKSKTAAWGPTAARVSRPTASYCLSRLWLATAVTATAAMGSRAAPEVSRTTQHGSRTILEPLFGRQHGSTGRGPLRCCWWGEGLTAHFKLQAVSPKLCTSRYFSAEQFPKRKTISGGPRWQNQDRLPLLLVQTIGEKPLAMVPILRPPRVPDLVICKKRPTFRFFPQNCTSN